MDRPWPSQAKMRQLIVRATNPRGKRLEVSVLTDDLERPPQQSITLIFNRWIQENDFKYLDKHFGINEITSYASVSYEELRGQLEDKQVQSGADKAFQQTAATQTTTGPLAFVRTSPPQKVSPAHGANQAIDRGTQGLGKSTGGRAKRSLASGGPH